MRILHGTAYLQRGGRARHQLAIAQRPRGHDVRVVADAGGAPGYASYPEYLDALTAAGVPVVTARSMFKRDASARSARKNQRLLVEALALPA